MCVDAFFVILVVHACCSGDYKPFQRRQHIAAEPVRAELYQALPRKQKDRMVKATFPHEEEKGSMLFEEEKAGRSFAGVSPSVGLFREPDDIGTGSSKSARIFGEPISRSKKSSGQQTSNEISLELRFEDVCSLQESKHGKHHAKKKRRGHHRKQTASSVPGFELPSPNQRSNEDSPSNELHQLREKAEENSKAPSHEAGQHHVEDSSAPPPATSDTQNLEPLQNMAPIAQAEEKPPETKRTSNTSEAWELESIQQEGHVQPVKAKQESEYITEKSTARA